MRSNSILLAAILLIASGCDKKEPDLSMRASIPAHHDQSVKIELSDPFDESVLAESLEIAGLEIVFLERPPRGGGHFVSLLKKTTESNKIDELNIVSMTSNWPEAEYASPAILRISLHTVPDGTPLRDSKDLRIRVKRDSAIYREGNQSGGSGNSKRNITIRNPFHGPYQGIFQYGPIIKSNHSDGISILVSESVEYRIIINASRPYERMNSEPDGAGQPDKHPEKS